jgi:hypothetical protein
MRTALHLFSLLGETRWISGRLVDSSNTTDETALSWAVPPVDPVSGAAGPPVGVLEDGSTPNLAMHTHPRWVPNGTIKGWFGWRRVGQRPVFKTKVGFIRGAGGEVNFQVWEHHRVGGREVWNQIIQFSKRATGALQELTADLSHLAGQEIQIELRVDAGEGSGQDWAVWVDPLIEYDQSEPAGDALTIASAGDWSGVNSVVVLFDAGGGTAFGISLPGADKTVQFPLASLGLRRGGRYQVLTIPQGQEAAWLTVPADGNLVVKPSGTVRPGFRLGDNVEFAATVWAVEPGVPSRQLATIKYAVTLGAQALTELTNRGFKKPERVFDALLGASPGQPISVTLEPQDAFGLPELASRPTSVPRSDLAAPEVGMPVQIVGEADIYWVVSFNAETVRLDVNHPWAGYRLRFDGTITLKPRGTEA